MGSCNLNENRQGGLKQHKVMGLYQAERPTYGSAVRMLTLTHQIAIWLETERKWDPQISTHRVLFLGKLKLGCCTEDRSAMWVRQRQNSQNTESMATSKGICLQVQSANATMSDRLLETKINGDGVLEIKQTMPGDSTKEKGGDFTESING